MSQESKGERSKVDIRKMFPRLPSEPIPITEVTGRNQGRTWAWGSALGASPSTPSLTDLKQLIWDYWHLPYRVSVRPT